MYQTVRLHQRDDLLQETVDLLNREWPRSPAARLASLEGSVDSLPCSLVLVDSECARVVGHARLMAVAGSPTGALVESVVVCPEKRGRGLGRRIMMECEAHCVGVGCHTLHLSTHDQQRFYLCLGYQDGPPVTGQRKCVSNLSQCESQSLLGADSTPHTPSPMDSTCPLSTSHTPHLPDSTSHTPPPPPPPLPKVVAQTDSSQSVTWMVKHLVQNI